MYQALIFSILLLTQLSFGKTNPLTDEEPLYTGAGSTSTASTTSTGTGSYPLGTSTTTTTQTTTASASTAGCKLDESVLLCLCDTQFAGQKELCYAAAEKPGPMNAFLAAFGAQQAARGATSGAAAQPAQMGQLDPMLASLYQEVQQTGGMDPQMMMMLFSVLLGDNNQQGAQPQQAGQNGMPGMEDLAFSGAQPYAQGSGQ